MDNILGTSDVHERYRSKYAGDALAFVREVIGVEPDPQQAEVLVELKPGAHISIRSGHGVGKSAFLSWAIIWFMSCYSFVRIPCTAGSKSQLRDVLWPEIAKWLRGVPKDLQQMFNWQTERITWGDKDPQTWFAAARTSRKENPDALQGFHEGNLMFVVDEAPGVPDEIFQVKEGALTEEGAIDIMTGNPTRLVGEFYRSHHKDRHMWKTFHFSSADSSLVSPRYAERIAKKYGIDSDVYRVRVRGDFPLAESDTFIPLHLIEEAALIDRVDVDRRNLWGLDPARFGDDESALVKRRGSVATVDGVRQFDTMHVAGWVANQAEKEKPDFIFIDVIGLGAGIYDRLRELGFKVVPVNVAEAASDKQEYYRCRDELWGLAKDGLKRGMDIQDEELKAQLSSPKYKFASNGAFWIETKDDMKKRGVDSPDRADAYCLTYYQPKKLFPGFGR